MKLKTYNPHEGQIAFHYAIQNLYRFVAMICGIRGGKTYAGAREATKQAWNSKADENAVFGIVAPTYHMLDRTTWREFIYAAKPLIDTNNDSKKIITLKNGRQVFGFSAERPDKIRNVTISDFWIDEARECKDFAGLWDIMLGRVLSTNGRGFVTTSPNSFDDIYDIFVEKGEKDYGTVKFSTYENRTITKEAIDSLASKYDKKFMEQELMGEFVVFEGQVYYTFNRSENAGSLAYKVAQYDPTNELNLCCDFNVDPMSWIVTQVGVNKQGLREIYVIDEIYLRNSNTREACGVFKDRFPSHSYGLFLYGDATGRARHSASNVTNWQIVRNELAEYNPVSRVPTSNPSERDRINAVNGLICNSKDERRVLVNPNCKRLIRDLEQVAFKEGTTKIDKGKDLSLTHSSDALGYQIDKEFGLGKGRIEGIKI